MGLNRCILRLLGSHEDVNSGLQVLLVLQGCSEGLLLVDHEISVRDYVGHGVETLRFDFFKC